MDLSRPKSWESEKLGDLALLTLGGDWGKDPEFEAADYSSALCIRGAEFRNWETDRGCTASLRKIKNSSLKSRILQEGDILVEISGGGPDQPVGRTVLIDRSTLSHFPGLPKICTNFLRLFRPCAGIAPGFLNLYLQFFYKSGEIRDYQAGSNNLRNLRFNDYLGLDIPLPPQPEQHRIVAKIEELFSELDKGIENLKTAQAQLKVYRQALLKHAFEGKLTTQWRADNPDKLEPADALLKRIQQERTHRYQQQLADWEAGGKQGSKPKAPKALAPLTAEELAEFPELPEGWAWLRVCNLADKVTDGEHITPKRTEAGFYLLSARNIQNGHLDLTDVDYVSTEEYDRIRKRCDPEEGDILISCSGSVGRVCRVPDDINFVMVRSVAVVKLQSVKAWSKFYEYLFQSPLLQRQIEKGKKATAQANLFLDPINNLKVIVCSPCEGDQLVKELESRLSEVDNLEQIMLTSLNQAEALRQSILKKAFSGQLVPQDPHDEPASVLLARIQAERANAAQKSALAGRRSRKVSTK